jgi:predicted dehydrogenase
MTRKLRWGIVSTANIGTMKVIPAMQRGARTEVVAIASRDLAKAQAAASRLGIPRAYGSYEDLFADPEVDAIYNPLPNHLHVLVSIQALQAGKHVLCEKPIGLSAEEGRRLVAAGKEHPRLKLMEAFMYRHHPQWIEAKRLSTNGSIGALKTISTLFSYFNDDGTDIRNQAGMGGGGLMDIGCYPISLSRFIFGGEPKRVFGCVEIDRRFGVDRIASAILEFEGGTSTFTCSTQLVPYQRVHLLGERGRVEIEIPFNAPPDKPCRLWHESDGRTNEILCDVADQYTIQGDLFAEAVLDDKPVPTPIEDAVANMVVIEAIFASGRSGRWESIGS